MFKFKHNVMGSVTCFGQPFIRIGLIVYFKHLTLIIFHLLDNNIVMGNKYVILNSENDRLILKCLHQIW